ncbi:MAG: hypothetical protein WCQ72_03180 [Eubacteriales bacterium]
MKRFLSALVISIIVFGAAAAMLSADAVSRSVGGDGGRTIFSYTVKSESRALLELFGSTYDIDRAPLKAAAAAGRSIGGFFTGTAPNAVRLYAEALSRGVWQLYETVAGDTDDEYSGFIPENADGV